jgi:hypothetical protein
MVNKAIVVPCTVLASIAFCMLAFICWWFPRTWAKGQALDMMEYRENTERRQRQRERDLELAASETATAENTDNPGNEADVKVVEGVGGESAGS